MQRCVDCLSSNIMIYMRSVPGEGGTARKVPVKDSSVPRLFGGSLIDYMQVRVLIGMVLSLMLFCACYIVQFKAFLGGTCSTYIVFILHMSNGFMLHKYVTCRNKMASRLHVD